jgi:hypothetical protein
MDRQERLELYKRMLKSYKRARWIKKLFFGTETDATRAGFCHWLGVKLNRPGMIYQLEELVHLHTVNQQRKHNVTYEEAKDLVVSGFWFKMGELNPRIDMLKQAIKDMYVPFSERPLIERYQILLSDYKRALLRKILTLGLFPDRTYSYGFCWYIYYKHGVYLTEALPELIELAKKEGIYKRITGVWYPEGELLPRIDMLKQAIKDIESL